MTKEEAIKIAQDKLEEQPEYRIAIILNEESYKELPNWEFEEMGIRTLCAADCHYLVRVIFSELQEMVSVMVVDTYRNKITNL